MYLISPLSSIFFFSSRRRHTRWPRDWSSDVCSSDLRQRRRIPLNHRRLRTIHSYTELRCKSVVVLETRHASREARQFLRGRSWPSAKLQHVFAKVRTLQNPGENSPPGHPPPQTRSTKPCFV